jgi:hypothetical protein
MTTLSSRLPGSKVTIHYEMGFEEYRDTIQSMLFVTSLIKDVEAQGDVERVLWFAHELLDIK